MQTSPMASVTISTVCGRPSFKAGNVLEIQPHAKFWAGERYYRRQHIDIDDFYPLDMSGYGGGVEDLNVGVGKLAVAFLSGARPDIVTQNGNLAKSNIDVRLYGVKGPQHLGYTCGSLVWVVRLRNVEGWYDLNRHGSTHVRRIRLRAEA